MTAPSAESTRVSQASQGAAWSNASLSSYTGLEILILRLETSWKHKVTLSSDSLRRSRSSFWVSLRTDSYLSGQTVQVHPSWPSVRITATWLRIHKTWQGEGQGPKVSMIILGVETAISPWTVLLFHPTTVCIVTTCKSSKHKHLWQPEFPNQTWTHWPSPPSTL